MPLDPPLRERLTARQYQVTQNCGTEPPFDNEYWNNKRSGIYVDIVSGKPLFSSRDKFDSGSGWPSFSRPIEPENLVSKVDQSLDTDRIEVRSKHSNSHLGHLFDDGPQPTGRRYCINSASLRFIPAQQLEEQGYGEYARHLDPVKEGDESSAKVETTVLAGGCFWGMEEILRSVPGVIDTEVGYIGGSLSQPNYNVVRQGTTGHAEAVRITFDPTELSYQSLLDIFFRMHDPTTPNQQGHDVGSQYRSAIFTTSEQQRKTAERVRSAVDASGKWPRPLVTEIRTAPMFWSAEDAHQDYLQRNPDGYSCHYLRD